MPAGRLQAAPEAAPTAAPRGTSLGRPMRRARSIRHRCDRDRVHRLHPPGAAVGAAAEPVEGRGRPDDEVQVVGDAPPAVGDAPPVVVRDRKGDQAARRRRCRAPPRSACSGRQDGTTSWVMLKGRNESIGTVAMCRVRNAPDQQAAEPVDVLDGEPRPPGQPFAAGEPDPDADDGGQQDIGDDPGGPGRVPVDRARGQVHAGQPSVISAHRRVMTTISVTVNEPAGEPVVVQPVGPVAAQQECSPGCGIGVQAGRSTGGDLLPRRGRGPPGASVDQVVLHDSVAYPPAAGRCRWWPGRPAPAAPRRRPAARCRWARQSPGRRRPRPSRPRGAAPRRRRRPSP